MTKHTQGPWGIINSFHDFDDGEIASTFSIFTQSTRLGEFICKLHPGDGKSLDEIEANAKLIAAAPDLLEALKDLRDAERHCYGPTVTAKRIKNRDDARIKADAAIAKAEAQND